MLKKKCKNNWKQTVKIKTEVSTMKRNPERMTTQDQSNRTLALRLMKKMQKHTDSLESGQRKQKSMNLNKWTASCKKI
jgi:hypothetical protein